jgi:hypothetical protein
MPYPTLELNEIQTYPIAERRNLVTREDLVWPHDPSPPFEHPELAQVALKIAEARNQDRPVLCMFGAHVIKSGLGPLLIAMMRKGWLTHLATNGAGSIHDTELALIGETSEDVADSIETGLFGMADETSTLINGAVQAGRQDGLGYGEAVGRMIAQDDRFQHRDISVFGQAYQMRVPMTVHICIGTDIIHQHPSVDFAALGWASGRDFKVYCKTVSELEGGVFLNFGSAVLGPEVFLKALSIARNLGYTVSHITTANFDLLPLKGDYHAPLGYDNPEYYYRPRKNIVNRPTSMGGQGYHITGDHRETLPNLYQRVADHMS